jgi:hypothetical protein
MKKTEKIGLYASLRDCFIFSLYITVEYSVFYYLCLEYMFCVTSLMECYITSFFLTGIVSVSYYIIFELEEEEEHGE